MKKIFLTFLSLFLLIAACKEKGDNTEEQASQFLIKEWAENEWWDDGLAEVAIYDAKKVVYDKPRSFEYAYILVKEDFNKAYNTKTSDYERNDLFEVMKINKFARIPTEKYPYHYLTSLFYNRNEPAVLHKMTSSSQEWCGNTFKQFENKGSSYRFIYSSYWDEEGSNYTKIKGNVWFEDGLSYTLRTLNFRDGLTFDQQLVESQISNKAPKPAIYDAGFKVSATEHEGKAAWKVVVQLNKDKTNTYWFAKEYPNLLLKQENSDGFQLNLQSAKREAYWE